MLSFRDAQTKLFARVPRLGGERVALDAACGRVLHEDLMAPVDFPGFDQSVMDGYAVACADFVGDGPWELPVAGESRAGEVSSPMQKGAACRIFTGAEMPRGADAVIMQEDVVREGDRARFPSRPERGAFVRARAVDLAKGALAIAKGTRLRPSHLGLAAASDAAWLTVARRPTMILLGTGDELRAPGTAPQPGKIAESNCVALRAMGIAAGAEVIVAPFVRDDPALTAQAFDEALRAADVVVSIGGVSVGDHDLVRAALESLGVELEFWRVAMKPGKPLAVGRKGERIVLGLPGNPASAMVTFALFGVPLLRAMQGDARPLPSPLRARSGVALKRSSGRLEFARARLDRSSSVPVVTPLANQASGAVTTMAEADALMCIPAECTELHVGDEVDVLLFEDLLA
ncbi:MAG: gephyrin-like molybdotransferase Glp [Polyangiaceae bacterium]